MKRDYLINIFLGVVFLALIITACDDTVPPELGDIPASNVSYSKHIQPIFNAYCNNSGCHNAQDSAGDLELTSHYEVTKYPIVIPGEPDISELVKAIEGRRLPQMPPPGYWPLEYPQTKGIRTWVKEGAKNN